MRCRLSNQKVRFIHIYNVYNNIIYMHAYVRSAAAAAAAALCVAVLMLLLLQQQCCCFLLMLLLFVIVCRMAKLGAGSLNLISLIFFLFT